MNNDCFAYKKKRCKILKEILCSNDNCPFYKTVEGHKEGIIRANAGIAALDKAVQKYIADTYFKGKYPWQKVGGTHGC